MLFGMATEIGELMDVFKKNLAYDTTIDWINVREEIGDIMFYLASFCRINNIDLDTVIGVNVAKLMSRYPENFDKWRANNRDLKTEREILTPEKK
jgi:NTP pyrophosphatase (non-canonical NTP hydrolase)